VGSAAADAPDLSSADWRLPNGEKSMSDRYLRRTDVEHQSGLSRSTIYRRINDGTFPAPFYLGGNCVRWRERDLVD